MESHQGGRMRINQRTTRNTHSQAKPFGLHCHGRTRMTMNAGTVAAPKTIKGMQWNAQANKLKLFYRWQSAREREKERRRRTGSPWNMCLCISATQLSSHLVIEPIVQFPRLQNCRSVSCGLPEWMRYAQWPIATRPSTNYLLHILVFWIFRIDSLATFC